MAKAIVNKQREDMREQVQDLELKARYWKAQVDTMVYSLEYSEILPKYQEHLKKEKEKEDKFLAELQEKIKKETEEKVEDTIQDPIQ